MFVRTLIDSRMLLIFFPAEISILGLVVSEFKIGGAASSPARKFDILHVGLSLQVAVL
jgi:hypothetical protein